jgi:hypothetical protein
MAKLPKPRAFLFLVVREMEGKRAAFLGAYSDAVEADDYKGACAAEWFDRTGGAPADFTVTAVPFYG